LKIENASFLEYNITGKNGIIISLQVAYFSELIYFGKHLVKMLIFVLPTEKRLVVAFWTFFQISRQKTAN